MREAHRAQPTRSLRRLLTCIRFDEVLVLQGSPLLGAFFAIRALDLSSAGTIGLLVIGNMLLVAHVFVLNDWSGIAGDRQDPQRAMRVFTTKGIERTDVGRLALALLGASLLVFGRLGATPLMLALAIVGLSTLYSAPGLQMKGIPVASSLLHLVGGSLHFLLGFGTFAAIDGRAVAISAFFALVFTAGHLMHEARGHEGDSINGIRTNAVVFGQQRSLFAGFALFTIAQALLVVLAALGLLPRLLVMTAALYPLHAYATVEAVRAGLTFDSLRRLQDCHRLIYGVIGVAMILTARPA